MGRLIKYELKKQRTSRNITLAMLLVFILVYSFGIVSDKEKVVGISLGLLMMAGTFVLFYMGIESLIIFNRDLKTKQSHMLWMVPRSSWQILGAKFIAAILQIFFIFAAYMVTGIISAAVLVTKEAKWQDVIWTVQQMMESLLQRKVDLWSVAVVLFVLFLMWTMVIMTGFFAIIVSRTVLINSRFAGIVSFVLFILINLGIEKLYVVLNTLHAFSAGPDVAGIRMTEVIYLVLVCIVMFAGSSMLAEKKLSV